MSRERLVAIIGPTASGKTALGVGLALAMNGEIISADSRQVYRGMDIGTGKDLAEYGKGKKRVKHHLINIASPNTSFSLAKYLKAANMAVEDVLSRDKLPIFVGGTGLYIQALVDNYALAESKPDFVKRNEREKLEAEELMEMIARLQPAFAAKINESDRHNRRRLARYLEVLEQGGEIGRSKRQESPYEFLVVGLDWPDDVLKERIGRRLDERLEQGMVEEVRALHEAGVTWKRLVSFGLEYRFVSWYLMEKMDYEQMREKLGTAIYRFAKRQKTWFRRWEKQGQKIYWVDGIKEAEGLIKGFLQG